MSRHRFPWIVGIVVAAFIAAGCAPAPAPQPAKPAAEPAKPAAAPAKPAAEPAKPAAEPAKPAAQPAKPAAAPAKPAAQPAKPAAAPIKWRAAYFGPPRATTVGDEWWAKELATRTNGRMQVEIAYGETLAKATEIPDGLKAGAFEMGFMCASYYPGKLPLLGVGDLAFLAPENPENFDRLQLALFEQPAIKEELAKWNATWVLPGGLPQWQIISKKRIAKAEDFKGVRMRISAGQGKVLEEFGLVITHMPAPEMYTALDKGTLDAVSSAGTYGFATYKLDEISKFYIDKISLGSELCFRGANLDAWNKLPPDIQKLMRDLVPGASKATAGAYAEADAKNYPVFRQKMEIINFPTAERAKLLAKAEKYWKEWVDDKVKKGLKGQEVYDFAQAKAKELTRS